MFAPINRNEVAACGYPASLFGKPVARTGSASGDRRGQRVAFGTLFATSSPTCWPIAEPTSVE